MMYYGPLAAPPSTRCLPTEGSEASIHSADAWAPQGDADRARSRRGRVASVCDPARHIDVAGGGPASTASADAHGEHRRLVVVVRAPRANRRHATDVGIWARYAAGQSMDAGAARSPPGFPCVFATVAHIRSGCRSKDAGAFGAARHPGGD